MNYLNRLTGCHRLLARLFRTFQANKSKNVVCGQTKGGSVIIGVYTNGKNFKLTKTGEHFNAVVSGRLTQVLAISPPIIERGEVKLFNGFHESYPSVAIVGLGDECTGYNVHEMIDEQKEVIRAATGAGARALHTHDTKAILVDSCGHAESAAEGVTLGTFLYQDFKQFSKRKPAPVFQLLDSCDFTGWQVGLHKGAAQNLTRHLQEIPPNYLTPQSFSYYVIKLLANYSINVEVRMKQWAYLRNLNAFLAVGQGACDPIFMEIFYEGCDPNVCPIVLVGKGITFSTGGLCKTKTCKSMQKMRGDMIGAACVVATMRAVAALQLPVNIRGLIPLCSNIFASKAIKPGDTVRAFNGKTIRIDSTDCDGLLMHADAIGYASVYNPKFIVDIGSMVDDSYAAMGQGANLVFANNESLYETMRVACMHTGDRMWRFPLWNYYSEYMKPKTSDLTNKAHWMVGGGPCKAAAFLREFVPPKCDWLHIDVQNTFTTTGEDFKYLASGMSGRATRSLVEFIAQLACHHNTKTQ